MNGYKRLENYYEKYGISYNATIEEIDNMLRDKYHKSTDATEKNNIKLAKEALVKNKEQYDEALKRQIKDDKELNVLLERRKLRKPLDEQRVIGVSVTQKTKVNVKQLPPKKVQVAPSRRKTNENPNYVLKKDNKYAFSYIYKAGLVMMLSSTIIGVIIGLGVVGKVKYDEYVDKTSNYCVEFSIKEGDTKESLKRLGRDVGFSCDSSGKYQKNKDFDHFEPGDKVIARSTSRNVNKLFMDEKRNAKVISAEEAINSLIKTDSMTGKFEKYYDDTHSTNEERIDNAFDFYVPDDSVNENRMVLKP